MRRLCVACKQVERLAERGGCCAVCTIINELAWVARNRWPYQGIRNAKELEQAL